MAKTKRNVEAHAKKSVATNVMFKKDGKEALRQRDPLHMKDAVEKSTKASKSNKGHKSKRVVKHIAEHTLAAEFAGRICHPNIPISL